MPPDLELYEAVDWSSIGDWDEPAYELDYDLVWDDDGHEGAIHLFHLYSMILICVSNNRFSLVLSCMHGYQIKVKVLVREDKNKLMSTHLT
jgi:hypothetical protein